MVGECKEIDVCIGAAIASNCSSAKHICCISEPNEAPVETPHKLISKEQFLKIADNTSRNSALYRYFSESLSLANVTTVYQVAAYLSQLIDETSYFRKIESIIMETDLNAGIGNNQTGDGVAFRGRGGVLLRGRRNYYLANEAANTELVSKSGKCWLGLVGLPFLLGSVVCVDYLFLDCFLLRGNSEPL